MKKRLRASFSLLQAWEKNDIDGAISLYKHEKTFTNAGMDLGRKWHKKWEAEINKNKSVTIGKTTFEFKNPKCEFKKYVPYADYCDLSVVLDCIDGLNLYEWKTGASTGSLEYATKEQIPIYFLACELLKLPVKTAYVVHYNQEIKEADITIVHNTPFKRALARNYIDSLAPELYMEFEKRNLL